MGIICEPSNVCAIDWMRGRNWIQWQGDVRWLVMVHEVKGYRLYDPKRVGKMIYSRDVKFNESEFGIEKELSPGKSTRYVELELSSPAKEITAEESVLRRSGGVTGRPDYFREHMSVAESGQEEPITVKETLAGQQKVRRENSVEAEVRSVRGNGVWELPYSREYKYRYL